jgi:AcrR family transcriptional regulator
MPVVPKSLLRREKIIDAAGKLFARQGYHGTSTRQIAQLAGVSENTLFRQFIHKEELFWATLRHHSSGLKLRRDLMDGLAQCSHPEIVLPKLLSLLADTANYKPELLQMIAVAFLELNWNAEPFSVEYLSPFLSQVHRYLGTSIKEGKLRAADPTILTAALMTTPLMHPGIARLIHSDNPAFRSNEGGGRAYVKFWLDLLTPGLSEASTLVRETISESLG